MRTSLQLNIHHINTMFEMFTAMNQWQSIASKGILEKL